MLKVTRGIVKAKGKYYHKGDTVKGLTKAQEKALLESGLVIEISEKPLKQTVSAETEQGKAEAEQEKTEAEQGKAEEDKAPPLES